MRLLLQLFLFLLLLYLAFWLLLLPIWLLLLSGSPANFQLAPAESIPLARFSALALVSSLSVYFIKLLYLSTTNYSTHTLVLALPPISPSRW
jgi:hypothetical protein